MKQFNQILLYLLFLVALWGIGFVMGIRYEKKNHNIEDNVEIVRVDTITVKEEIIKPIPQYVTKLRTDTIITTDIDTLFLPIEQKVYIKEINNDTVKGSIKAVLSGYSSVLDTLQYNLSFEQKTLLKRKKLGFTIGPAIGIGYDINNKKFNPYIGIGVTWGLNL